MVRKKMKEVKKKKVRAIVWRKWKGKSGKKEIKKKKSRLLLVNIGEKKIISQY